MRARIIAQNLAERGWDVKAVTRAGSLSHFQLDRSARLTVLEIPGFSRRRIGGALFLIVGVPAGIVWGRRASAFVSIRLTSPTTAAAVCALLLRRPFLALTTSSGGLSEVRYVTSTRSAPLRRWLLRRAAFLVAQTEFAAAELELLVGRGRIAVVPNPVKEVAPPPLNRRPHAVYTGRLSAEKILAASSWRGGSSLRSLGMPA